MTNFAKASETKKVAMEIAADTVLPNGAINWVYSDWNFSNPKPVKFSW